MERHNNDIQMSKGISEQYSVDHGAYMTMNNMATAVFLKFKAFFMQYPSLVEVYSKMFLDEATNTVKDPVLHGKFRQVYINGGKKYIDQPSETKVNARMIQELKNFMEIDPKKKSMDAIFRSAEESISMINHSLHIKVMSISNQFGLHILSKMDDIMLSDFLKQTDDRKRMKSAIDNQSQAGSVAGNEDPDTEIMDDIRIYLEDISRSKDIQKSLKQQQHGTATGPDSETAKIKQQQQKASLASQKRESEMFAICQQLAAQLKSSPGGKQGFQGKGNTGGRGTGAGAGASGGAGRGPNTCRDFMKGDCQYGTSCRFPHTKGMGGSLSVSYSKRGDQKAEADGAGDGGAAGTAGTAIRPSNSVRGTDGKFGKAMPHERACTKGLVLCTNHTDYGTCRFGANCARSHGPEGRAPTSTHSVTKQLPPNPGNGKQNSVLVILPEDVIDLLQSHRINSFILSVHGTWEEAHARVEQILLVDHDKRPDYVLVLREHVDSAVDADDIISWHEDVKILLLRISTDTSLEELASYTFNHLIQWAHHQQEEARLVKISSPVPAKLLTVVDSGGAFIPKTVPINSLEDMVTHTYQLEYRNLRREAEARRNKVLLCGKSQVPSLPVQNTISPGYTHFVHRQGEFEDECVNPVPTTLSSSAESTMFFETAASVRLPAALVTIAPRRATASGRTQKVGPFTLASPVTSNTDVMMNELCQRDPDAPDIINIRKKLGMVLNLRLD